MSRGEKGDKGITLTATRPGFKRASVIEIAEVPANMLVCRNPKCSNVGGHPLRCNGLCPSLHEFMKLPKGERLEDLYGDRA